MPQDSTVASSGSPSGRTSGLGQLRRFGDVGYSSAYPSIAAELVRCGERRYVPCVDDFAISRPIVVTGCMSGFPKRGRPIGDHFNVTYVPVKSRPLHQKRKIWHR